MSPSLQKWMNEQVDEQRFDRERKKTKHSKWWDFGMVMILICGLAVWADQHHNEDLTEQIDRGEILSRQWDGKQDIGTAVSRELFIMRTARNSAELLDKLHQGERYAYK